MRHPQVTRSVAKALAQNCMEINAIRETILKTVQGSEQSVVLMDALNPLYEERSELIEKGFNGAEA
jgi:hypothetical protein